jgi:DNA-binding winged helix-turn-helix (wHTH) protein
VDGETLRDGFRLGDWLVLPSLNRLSRGGECRRLEPRVMDVLVALAAAEGRVIPPERLIDEVWARQFVAESTLTRAVTLLRQALGDDVHRPRYIETIARRGYRVVAEVAPIVAAGRGPADGVAAGPALAVLIGEQELELGEGVHVIGRDTDVELRVDSLKVSRRHARIVVHGGRATLEDLGSKNGTFLRGRRLAEPVLLADGDEICVGGQVLVVRDLARCVSTETEHPG